MLWKTEPVHSSESSPQIIKVSPASEVLSTFLGINDLHREIIIFTSCFRFWHLSCGKHFKFNVCIRYLLSSWFVWRDWVWSQRPSWGRKWILTSFDFSSVLLLIGRGRQRWEKLLNYTLLGLERDCILFSRKVLAEYSKQLKQRQ